jgi:amino acid adenylation domain-containing protein
VYFEGDTLTYSELNARANRLGRLLQRHGVGIGSYVGVSMKRSLEMVVALLAVLKAGAAFVPLDPYQPEERLRLIAADAGLNVILTRGRRVKIPNAHIIDLKDEYCEGEDSRNFASGVENGDLAYAVYTSGSTGKPKGVMIPHRGVVNWLIWMRNAFEVTPADVVLKKAPLTFDVSLWELFLPLISGARLVLADSDRQYDPTYLANLMASTRVTVAQFVPSLMRSFFELETFPDLSALRHVMCGGEVLPPKLQNAFLRRTNSQLCNSYGPTECSIGVTRWPCRLDDDRPSVPIGYAIDNTDLYILDDNLEPVPPNVAGELFIGGICVGRGYLNRPDLTAERFIPNPFNPDGEARMYRTGDMCKFLDDGSIDFLGRMDDQVKIRGVRIELGEVEKALGEHEAVQAAAAAATQDESRKSLIAYVVRSPGHALTKSQLRAFLRKKLPLAMIPSEFLFVESLPLSANGKIDRKKLAELRVPSAPAPAAVPRGEVERRIAAIWKDLLKGAAFGMEDDFFDCGGDSLMALELIIRLEKEFKTKIRLDDVLEPFSVAGIAKLVRELKVDGPGSAVRAPARTRIKSEDGSEIVCRFGQMDDVRGVWEVCSRAFASYAHSSLQDFEELCRYRWADNPLRTDDDPFGWVLENSEGRIVGFHGLVPVRLWVGGKTVAGISPTTWAADPGIGHAGLTLLSTYLSWGQDRFLLNTTANAITSAMHEASNLGMKKIPIADFDQRLLWVIDFRSLVGWKLNQNGSQTSLNWAAKTVIGALAPFAFGVAGGVRAGLNAGLHGMQIKFDCRPLQVEPITHFGPEFDLLWDRLKHDHAVTIERSSVFLNWRHGKLPRLLGRAHALACREKGELVGYIALREPVTTAPGHFIVTDLFYDRTRPDVLHNLMNAAFELALSKSASVIELFGFHPELNRQLRSQKPYILRRSQLERLGRSRSLTHIAAGLSRAGRNNLSTTYWYRAPNSDLDAVCSNGQWWPSGVDGDLNL